MLGFLAKLPLWSNPLAAVQWGVVIGAALAAAIVDARSGRIPNKLTLPLFGGGLAWAWGMGGLAGLGEAMAACIVLSAPFIILFLGGAGGAGDAKLMGAVGTWLGLLNGTIALVAVVLVGAALGLLVAVAKGRFLDVLQQVRGLAGRMILAGAPGVGLGAGGGMLRPGTQGESIPMPYGVAIFLGITAAGVGVVLWHALS
jgi:prepilin peptidase CpaA